MARTPRCDHTTGGARSWIVAVAAVLALAGCGGGDSDTSTVSPATTPPVTTSDPAPTVTASQEEADPPTTSDVAVVDAITTSGEAGFDRILITFTSPPGAWSTSFETRITEDPSDRPVPLDGSAFLIVRMQSATLDNQLQAGDGVPHLRYEGPLPIAPSGLGNVVEIARAGDFEAVLSMAVGLQREAGVRVTRPSPDQIAIDVAH